VDEKKTQAIQDWKRPETTKELQRFLGLVNYYRDFIKGLGKIEKPLYEIKDKEELEWTEKRKAAFDKLKKTAAELPYRVLWDPEKKQHIRTDASEEGLGLVLEQEEEQGWWPLAFYSRTWRENEKNWPIHHQEMCTFVEALKKWRHYLLDKRIVAQTDSKFVERTSSQKAMAGRLIHW
jgi:RNase H-like domain found in reverse transcriptase